MSTETTAATTAGTPATSPADPVEEVSADDFSHARTLDVDHDWYKRAVFYEVLVRAFNDSNRDGTGDLRGLTEKLDYLQWLGVDCLWLPPFYDSPLRDGGYDIRDFRTVLPEFGTVEDFVTLLDEAHKRGIRVITDLVMNHTSDTHPWFEESRRHPEGPTATSTCGRTTTRATPRRASSSSTPSSRTGPTTRCAGSSTGTGSSPTSPTSTTTARPCRRPCSTSCASGWTSASTGSGWTRCPTSTPATARTARTSPRPTRSCACRKVLEDEYPGRCMLAEANQWPSDVVEYFGDPEVGGDECHMAFHFPLMPRIFMAVRRENRFPISEILAQTPAIPSGAQWGIFLRNHDELTLEMVSDEERDYMYAEYAKDPRMKANIGIRRRLAPLLENDRNQLELFTALLLSLPGSPVLYYGDEIGMGDNIWLGDRDAVRSPMQWTPDRNAGFSSSDPGRIYLPPIMDPLYGYQAVNVEAQLNSTTSLLHWNRHMIEVRKRHSAFGLGDYHELGGSNPSRARVRAQPRHATVLCVNNMSRFPQPVELDLSAWLGSQPPS